MICYGANPVCALPFHYLRGGRLYYFDLVFPSTPCADVPNAICRLKATRAVVFFWLWGQCSSKYSLCFNFRDGVSLAPLTSPARKSQHGTGDYRVGRTVRASI